MGFFDFFPLGSNSDPVPTFTQGPGRDATDLQVQSLLYLFKRLRINRLATFSLGDTLKYTDGKLWGQGMINHEGNISKLDKSYNLQRFLKLLVEDEHRVLIDWPKNKFRALCFLSEYPTGSGTTLLPDTISKHEDGSLPGFVDYKDRPVHSFAFMVLPVNTSIFVRDLALDLAQSLLYLEHHSYISFTSRIQTAEKAIAKFSEKGATMLELTEALKASIVLEYLRQLAFLVQLVRIYQQYIKPKEPETPLGSPKKTTADLPRSLRLAKSFLQLPNVGKIPIKPTLSPKKSMANLTSTSPKRTMGDLSPVKLEAGLRKQLTSRPSISNFRANEIYNPVTSPPISASNSENRVIGSGALLSHLSEYGRENTDLWEKCRASIQEKLNKEREFLSRHSG